MIYLTAVTAICAALALLMNYHDKSEKTRDAFKRSVLYGFAALCLGFQVYSIVAFALKVEPASRTEIMGLALNVGTLVLVGSLWVVSILFVLPTLAKFESSKFLLGKTINTINNLADVMKDMTRTQPNPQDMNHRITEIMNGLWSDVEKAFPSSKK